MAIIVQDYGTVSGGGYTFIDDTNPINGDKTYTTRNGSLWAKGTGSSYQNVNGITVNDGIVVNSYDTPYGTCSYSNGVITMHTTGYTQQQITGYIE